ncbi:Sugar fermentation stimulation protein [Peptoniphilus sp. ING2-D1G]|nr:Sugar fermentation stimulation protein [Peptoniphilus sp. ING2-D1G]
MKYENTLNGKFIERTNRFICYCDINGEKNKVYVPNTGRCKEILVEGADVVLSESKDSHRKTKYTLLSVYTNGGLINIDSQAPNKIVYDAIIERKIFKDVELTIISKEKSYLDSRFDIYYEGLRKEKLIKGFIEIKGVTLFENNIAYFPDAPTLRGLKHIKELITALKEGYESNIVLLIQKQGSKYFLPNYKMQPEFAKYLYKAQTQGVNIKAYDTLVTENEITLNSEIPIGDLKQFK